VTSWWKPWGQAVGVGLALSAGCASGQYAADGRPAPGLTLPRRADLEEGEAGSDAGARDAGPSGASLREAGALPHGTLPDPKALRLARQWEYEIVHDRGEVRVESVTERNFSQPVVTARRMGRYAIELWIGKELVERVRFDFPLLAAEEVKSGRRHPLKEPPSFAPGAVVSRRVLVPASPRATRAVLVDRATGWTLGLDWPPHEPVPPEPSPSSLPRPPPAADAAVPADASLAGPDAG
jgi:hypothetical protein